MASPLVRCLAASLAPAVLFGIIVYMYRHQMDLPLYEENADFNITDIVGVCNGIVDSWKNDKETVVRSVAVTSRLESRCQAVENIVGLIEKAEGKEEIKANKLRYVLAYNVHYVDNFCLQYFCERLI